MKIIIISTIITLYACMNQAEKNELDHVVLPTIEAQKERTPDTFIPEVPDEQLPINQESLKESTAQAKSSTVDENLIDMNNQPQNVDAPSSQSTSTQTPVSVNNSKTKVTSKEASEAPIATESAHSTTIAASSSAESSEVKQSPVIDPNVRVVAPETELNTKDQLKQAVDSPEAAIISTPDHTAFAELLKTYVSNSGDVNYKGIKSSESKLDEYLSELDINSIQSDWSQNEQLAYWMNAYNAFTIKLILNNYPVSKITDLHGGKPWDAKWINLGGKTYSLNNIEHDIIRPTFKDPRIHFAVNCAAKSCPPLLNKAYTADNVNRLLNNVTKDFVNSSDNQISSDAVQLSKIFEWYADDFGNIIKFLNQYSAKKIDSDAKVGYLDYDWSLNEG